jgi:predicted DNA-binding transcriptional regulator AlpA
MHTEHELLTTAEVAELTRTPIGTLRYWRFCNTGPRSFRLGRRVVYRASDLQAWISAQETTGDGIAGSRTARA